MNQRVYTNIIIEAPNINIIGNLTVENTDIVSFANIQTKDLLITDPVTQIARDNNDIISDRGFLLNYIDKTVLKNLRKIKIN